MSQQGPLTRWWRRDYDAALRDAHQAREAAGGAMLELDSALSDLPDAVAAHEEAGARQRASAPDPLLRDWHDLSGRTDAVIGRYLRTLADHDDARQTDVAEARAARAAFEQAAGALREVLPLVRRFREQYATHLASAQGVRTLAPRRVADAVAALGTARTAVDAALDSGLLDPALIRDLERTTAATDAAQQALAERRMTAASEGAAAAKAQADALVARARELPARAAEARRGAASTRTRREGLVTRRNRLGSVMSELRRRYRHGSWADVEKAPQRADSALAEVDSTLARLDQLLAARNLDVPAALTALGEARAAAARVEREVQSVTDRLTQLDQASADPGSLLASVRREVVDARRFLAALPPGRADRYRTTFDNLGRRLLALEDVVQEHRPDWGRVVTEARSIEDGLAAMVRTARAEYPSG